MAFEPRRFPLSERKCVVERALVVNLKPGKDLCDALQVAKSLLKTTIRSNVKFTDIFRVRPQKYVVLVEVVQDARVGIENAKKG